jgi:broad specificity phosphatase PhoE
MPALYVIRHGEPAMTGVLLGQTDPPLSSKGISDASRLAEVARDGIVYTSPLLRARQTASYLHSNPVIVPEFIEITYGVWDGLSWNEIELRYPEQARAKMKQWEAVTPPKAESWEHFCSRVRLGLSRVLQGELPAVIVGHEAVNAVIARELGNSQIHSYKQSYCELVEYRLEDSN